MSLVGSGVFGRFLQVNLVGSGVFGRFLKVSLVGLGVFGRFSQLSLVDMGSSERALSCVRQILREEDGSERERGAKRGSLLLGILLFGGLVRALSSF